jgi:AraC family transcriptional regulator of adaptative response / DNA-3-methyladenine glycosylase II
VAADEIRLDGSVGLEQLVASVTAIDGLGPWTGHYLALRMGEPDAFPATDLGLRRALGGPAARELAVLAEGWRPWRALAATHLWAADASSLASRAAA